MTTTEISRTNLGGSARGALSADPFTSLRFHFGMLLGVEDFEAEQAYHRGKQWLHSAWLHGKGVVWGYDVATDVDVGEIQVDAGLAIDGAGTELYLAGRRCLNVAAWYKEHQDDPFDFSVDAATVTFDARVVVRFDSCLSRQVPAIGEECNGSSTGTAYSRVEEQPELLLRPLGPGRWVDPPVPGSHLVRLLFGLDEARTDAGGTVLAPDQLVLDALADIAALPSGDQPPACLAAFRRFAALDGIAAAAEVSAATDLGFPHPDHDLEVTLAEVRGITLTVDGEACDLTATDRPDPTVRPSLLATRTIQELLCGRLAGDTAVPGAAAPRVVRESVSMPEDDVIELLILGDVLDSSVDHRSFAVSSWTEAGGWQGYGVGLPDVAALPGADPPPGRRVRLPLPQPIPDGAVVRVIVRGTGPYPILGAGPVPLGGETGGPPAHPHDGTDFTHMADKTSLQDEEDEE